MVIILIRHGESEANAINKDSYVMFTGQWECHLTARGILQAKQLKNNEIFSDVEKYYVSDSLRAQETASYFADPSKIVLDSRLRERSLGEFEGKKVQVIRNNIKYKDYFIDSEYMKFRHDFSVHAPGGENYSDVCIRVRSFLDDMKKHEYNKVVIVTHMCTIRCIIKELCNYSEKEILTINVPKCEPIIIDLE